MWHHFNYERAAEMRKKYIPLEKVLSVVDLTSTDVILDVGGGDGFYSNLFSEKCSKVYYVDASDSAVNVVKENISGTRGNVEVIQDDICTMNLPKDLTKVFFSNSFHDLGCREKLIDRITEISLCECIGIHFTKGNNFRGCIRSGFSQRQTQPVPCRLFRVGTSTI